MARKQARRPVRKPPLQRNKRADRRPALLIVAAILVVVGALAAAVVATSGPSGATGPNNTAPTLLASTEGQSQGQPVDGIECQQMEQVLYHIHAHLAVYVNGDPRLIPAGVGIVGGSPESTSSGPVVASGTCFYWLHSHTEDGIIHIESPQGRTYTLGNFFDIWRQPLSADQVGPARGQVFVYLNGKRFSGDPRSVPLTAHALIQLSVGKDVAAQPFVFPSGL